VSLVDPAEVARFKQQAARWWDESGPAGPLHHLNRPRMSFVSEHADLCGARAADVGCGGGLVSEALANSGAKVTAIDATAELIEVAKLHALESELEIDYRCCTAKALADESAGSFDVVTALELIEHVPDQAGLIADLARMLRPGGKLFLSTLDRRPMSFLLGIVAAEYVLSLLPRGTHRYDRFLRPSELIGLGRDVGLQPVAIGGLFYDPLSRRAWRTDKPQINYLLCMQRPL